MLHSSLTLSNLHSSPRFLRGTLCQWRIYYSQQLRQWMRPAAGVDSWIQEQVSIVWSGYRNCPRRNGWQSRLIIIWKLKLRMIKMSKWGEFQVTDCIRHHINTSHLSHQLHRPCDKLVVGNWMDESFCKGYVHWHRLPTTKNDFAPLFLYRCADLCSFLFTYYRLVWEHSTQFWLITWSEPWTVSRHTTKMS